MKKLILFLLFLSPIFGQVPPDSLDFTLKQVNQGLMLSRVYNQDVTYVGQQYATNDSLSTRDGKSWASAVASITQAIARANANLPRNSTNPHLIIVCDNFISDSVYTIPAYVKVQALAATFSNKGSWTLGTGSTVVDNASIGGAIAQSDVTNLPDSLLSKTNLTAFNSHKNNSLIHFPKSQIDSVATIVSGVWNGTVIDSAKTSAKVYSVNGKKGTVVLSTSDISGLDSLYRYKKDFLTDNFPQQAILRSGDYIAIVDSATGFTKYITASQTISSQIIS